MAKRRTLKANWLKEKKRADELQQRVDALERRLIMLTRRKVQETEHPIVKFKAIRRLNQAEYNHVPHETIRAMIAKQFISNTDCDGNPQDCILDCIKWSEECVNYSPYDGEIYEVCGELTVLNMNSEQHSAFLL